MIAGIYIDDYKLPVFERRLAESGYAWDKSPGITRDTLLLRVTTDNPQALAHVISEANAEASAIGVRQ
jgi:hypothetical protein